MKKMRKVFSLLLSVVLVLGMMPLQGYATECQHTLTYSAGENGITAKCTVENCDYTGTATVELDSSVSLAYTGEPIEPLKISYSENWYGDPLKIEYENNTEVTKEETPQDIEEQTEQTEQKEQTEQTGEESQENPQPEKPLIPTAKASIQGVSITRTFKIVKGQLTVSAVVTASYGDAEPKTEVICKNAQGETVEAVLEGQPKVTTDYRQDMKAGDECSFTVDLNGAYSDQYELTAENGTFTVGQREVKIELDTPEIVYDGEAHTPKATAGDLVGEDAVELEYDEVTETAPGTYDILIKNLKGDAEVLKNYKLPENPKVSFTIQKTSQDAPATVKGEAGKITGVDSAMQYKAAEEEESAYKAVTGTEITDLEPGAYHVRYAETDTATASEAVTVEVEAAAAPVSEEETLKITLPADQTGYTLTVEGDKKEVKAGESVTITYQLKDRYTESGFAVAVNGETVSLDAAGKYTIEDIQENIEVTVTGVYPLVAIKFLNTTFLDVVTNVTFEQYLKERATLEIVAPPDAKAIHYAAKNEKVADPASIQDWTSYSQAVSLPASEGKAIFYAKVTAADDRVYYASTNGVVLDTTNPVIKIGGTNVTSGKTFYTTQQVTVTDASPVTIKLNGITPTDLEWDNENKVFAFTLAGDKNVAVYLITTEDAAGNKVNKTYKMQTIESLKEPIKDLTTDNMKPENRTAVGNIQTQVKSLAALAHTTAGEKEKLKQIEDACTELLKNVNYTITNKTTDLQWVKSSGKDLDINLDGAYKSVSKLLVDGKEVTQDKNGSKYTYKEDTSKVTLKSSYLQTLTNGKHKIQLVLNDGETGGSDEIQIYKAGTNPKTGDNGILFWTAASLVSLICLAVILPGKKKNHLA